MAVSVFFFGRCRLKRGLVTPEMSRPVWPLSTTCVAFSVTVTFDPPGAPLGHNSIIWPSLGLAAALAEAAPIRAEVSSPAASRPRRSVSVILYS